MTRDDAARRVEALRTRAATCRRCPLWRHATQTVFGEGALRPRLMLVGEQPGDVEDRDGHPFVGPAGRLLREVLGEIGIDAADVYLTNSVKHFKFETRGKRRIHEKANREEILACRMWLEEELAVVRPSVLVALGATAASALFGPAVKVMRDRGKPVASTLAPMASVTVHPASILRAPGRAARHDARARFAADLRAILKRLPRTPR
jgi:DNA polymerase